MSQVDLCALDELVDGAASQHRVGTRTLVLVRIESDVFVLDDRCSHEDFALSAGEVDASSREIECERHGAMFSLATGEPLSLPATKSVATYEVAIVNGRVLVEVPS